MKTYLEDRHSNTYLVKNIYFRNISSSPIHCWRNNNNMLSCNNSLFNLSYFKPFTPHIYFIQQIQVSFICGMKPFYVKLRIKKYFGKVTEAAD